MPEPTKDKGIRIPTTELIDRLVALIFKEGRSVSEIAEEHGMDERAVESAIRRFMTKA